MTIGVWIHAARLRDKTAWHNVATCRTLDLIKFGVKLIKLRQAGDPGPVRTGNPGLLYFQNPER